VRNDDVVECAHPLCRCLVEGEEGFCSPACAAGTSAAVQCACGHAECVGADEAAAGDDSGDDLDSSAATS